ncbi:MAG: hypothetical protein ACJAXN_002961 [Psychromonas sp.]|jgi:hypothetical protein
MSFICLLTPINNQYAKISKSTNEQIQAMKLMIEGDQEKIDNNEVAWCLRNSFLNQP